MKDENMLDIYKSKKLRIEEDIFTNEMMLNMNNSQCNFIEKRKTDIQQVYELYKLENSMIKIISLVLILLFVLGMASALAISDPLIKLGMFLSANAGLKVSIILLKNDHYDKKIEMCEKMLKEICRIESLLSSENKKFKDIIKTLKKELFIVKKNIKNEESLIRDNNSKTVVMNEELNEKQATYSKCKGR